MTTTEKGVKKIKEFVICNLVKNTNVFFSTSIDFNVIHIGHRIPIGLSTHISALIILDLKKKNKQFMISIFQSFDLLSLSRRERKRGQQIKSRFPLKSTETMDYIKKIRAGGIIGNCTWAIYIYRFCSLCSFIMVFADKIYSHFDLTS